MLRTSIIIISVLALGSVRAKTYKKVESIGFIAESNANDYVTLSVENSDNGPVYFLQILQDITSKSNLLLCEKWEYDTRGYGGDTCGSGGDGGNLPPVPPHNGTIHGPICHELCGALKDLADTKPDYPGIDSMLGLHNERCPLKQGFSYHIPRLTMPKKFDADFEMVRDYIDYEAYIIPGKHCTPANVEPFVRITLVFFPCDTGTSKSNVCAK